MRRPTLPNTTNQQEEKKKIKLEHHAKKWFKRNKPDKVSDFKSIQELLDTVNAWNTMLHLHGPKDTLEYLSLRNYNDKSIQFLVANLDLPATMNRAKEVKEITTNKRGMVTDLIKNQSLLTTINYLNKMLEIAGPNETLDFLASCNYSHGSIKFLTANLNLSPPLNRTIEADRIIYNKDVTPNKDFKTNYSLLHTIDYLNTMLTVHGPNETLRFLTTCDYSDQNIKFLTANLHLPQSMDKVTEADKIIAVPKEERISDFRNNQQLIINMDIWTSLAKNKEIDYVLSHLSQTSYRAKSIKLIVANLPLPKSMDKVAESNKIIEQTNKNVISKFKKELPNLEEKKLNLQALNHIIHSFDLPAKEAKSLTRDAVLKAQEILGQNIQAYLREKVQQASTEQAKLKLTDSLKQLQQKPNDIEIYLDKEDLKSLKEKAKNNSSNTNKYLTETSKNKQISSLHR